MQYLEQYVMKNLILLHHFENIVFKLGSLQLIRKIVKISKKISKVRNKS